MSRLQGKTAIVTGAASGFGKGIAERFAQEGCAVIVSDIAADAGESVAAAIRSAGGRAQFVRADVSASADVKAMIDAALAHFGRLDVIVNNAGTTHRNQPMLDVDEATFDRVYAVNVKSIYLTAMHAVPVFRRQGGGSFINIASTAGVRPRPGLTWYNGSKGAVIITSKSMAAELGPDRIRVNCINPVIGETGLLEQFMGMPTRQRIARSSSPPSRSAAFPPRPTSPPPACSTPATTPPSSPAPASKSTAAAASDRTALQHAPQPARPRLLDRARRTRARASRRAAAGGCGSGGGVGPAAVGREQRRGGAADGAGAAYGGADVGCGDRGVAAVDAWRERRLSMGCAT